MSPPPSGEPQAGLQHKQKASTLFALGMAENAAPAPPAWAGEEQPPVPDQGDGLLSQVAVSMPCLPVGGEPAALSDGGSISSPVGTRPPRSKSKGELVIVINEKLRNSK